MSELDAMDTTMDTTMDATMDTTPVTEPESSEQVTPDTSNVTETPSTTQKRWNLRQRKPADTTLSTSIDSMVLDESPEETLVKKAVKRSAPKTKTPLPKRKSITAENVSTMNTSVRGNSETMFNAISQGKSAIKTVASDWVDRYELDSECAMVELVLFIVRCCGGVSQVTNVDISGDLAEAIRSITENFREKSHEYPLTGPVQKKFKNNFCEFIWRLVEQCQHGLLYDGYMLETFVSWLVGFSDSQVRAFRHTSSLAGVKLLSGLTEIANKLNTEIDNTQRQVDAERNKQQTKKTGAGVNKIQALLKKQTELKDHKNELEEVMKSLFSSIFVHRYRDKKSEIRSLCITELGEWLQNYSGKFLQDSYLKYIGWMLYDKAGDVRLACLKVLDTLYSDPDTAPLMGLFTGRFKSRLLSMRLDVDDHAAVMAINVLDHMQNLKLLEMDECQEVCELLFLESKGISHAAGQFAISYLFSEDFMSKAKVKRPPKGCKKPTDQQIMINELIKFFVEVKIHQHAGYFVDSIWEHTEVLQEWKSMTELLLDDKCGVKLSGEEESVLIELMTCSVRKASGTTPPTGRAKGRVTSNKERKAYEESKQNISSHFMAVLPELMEKFGSSSENVVNLTSIPRYFELEVYAENRLQTQLDALLDNIHQLMIRHHDSTVFLECALTYEFLQNPEFSLHATTELAFKRVFEEIVDTFIAEFSVRDDVLMSEEEDEECISMIVNTQRLATIFKLHDIRCANLCEGMATLLVEGATNNCSEKILMNTLVCLKHEIMWNVLEIEETENYDKETMRKVLVKRNKLFSNCEHLIKFATGPAQREAFVSLSDLFAVFSKHLHTTNPPLAGLAYEAPPHLQDTLDEYIMHHVLHSFDGELDMEPTSEEEALQIAEKLNDRRVLLAGYLKMAMFGSIDMDRLATVWAEYISQYSNFGDLIKYSMSKCREQNPIAWSRIVVLSLQSAFTSYREENGFIDQHSAEWADIKDLARKFAMSLGIEHSKVRLPLVNLHREGIQFALWEVSPNMSITELETMDPPPYVDFFTILNEFSYRLLALDRTGEKGIVVFLKEQLPPNTLDILEEGKLAGWDSFLQYYNSVTLQQPVKGKVGGGAVAQPRVIQSNQARARKRPLKLNDSTAASESSIVRPPKVSRIEGTPPSMVESENSADMTESSTPPSNLRRSKRNVVPES